MTKLIDIRCRPPVGTFLKMAMYENKARSAEMAKAKGLELAPSMIEESVELFFEEMDSIGDYTACVSGSSGQSLSRSWLWMAPCPLPAHPNNSVGTYRPNSTSGAK